MPEKYCDFNPRTRELIAEAVRHILAGYCSQVVVNDYVKVYQCKNVIRIDLKVGEVK